MKYKSLFIVGLCLISLLAQAKEKYNQKEIEARLLWRAELGGSITSVELTPAGLLHVQARREKQKIGGKKIWLKDRYLLNGSGKVFWKGEEDRTVLIADRPNPVILEVLEQGIALEAIAQSGGSLWKTALEGMPVSFYFSPTLQKVFLVIPKGDSPAIMVAVDVAGGKILWKAEIGPLKGSLTSFGRELALLGGDLWWAAGGRAARVDATTGKVVWSAEIPEGDGVDSTWATDGATTWVLRGNQLFGFSPESGLLWQKEFPKGVESNGLAVHTDGLVASFRDAKRVGVVFLEKKSGNVLWQKELKHKEKKFGPPAGFAMSGDRLVFALNKDLIGFELPSGKEVYKNGIKGSVFEDLRELRVRGENVVLVGEMNAQSYAIADGKLQWKQEGFITPYVKQARIKAGALAYAFTNFYQTVSTGPEASHYKQEAGRYSAGSFNYQMAMGRAAEAQSRYAAQEGARSGSAWADIIKQIAEIDLQTVNQRIGPRYARFYKIMNKKFGSLQNVSKVDGVLLDLDTGGTQEAGVGKTSDACVSNILIDPESGRMYQLHQQVALMCKDEQRIDAYRFP